MKGFATLLLLLIVFSAGIYVGGSLGVLGKPNDVFLQTDYDLGVLPYFHHGDRVHWIDPNAPLVNGRIAAVPDIYVTSPSNPCTDLDSNGICTIGAGSGTYTYKCQHCGDPTIPIGTSGPGTWSGWGSNTGTLAAPSRVPSSAVAALFTLKVSDSAISGAPSVQPRVAAAGYAEPSGFNSLYARIARAFVAAFFTPVIPPGHPVKDTGPALAPINPPLTQAFVQCSGGKISVLSPDQWFPPTSSQLALGTKVKWVSQDGLASTFTVQNLGGSTAFTDACGTASLTSNASGYTPACTLAKDFSKAYVAYTIVDSTGKCTAPTDGFKITVIPSPSAPPTSIGTDLPGLR